MKKENKVNNFLYLYKQIPGKDVKRRDGKKEKQVQIGFTLNRFISVNFSVKSYRDIQKGEFNLRIDNQDLKNKANFSNFEFKSLELERSSRIFDRQNGFGTS